MILPKTIINIPPISRTSDIMSYCLTTDHKLHFSSAIIQHLAKMHASQRDIRARTPRKAAVSG